MIYCNFRTSSEIHPNLERMGESFEHIITVRARGERGMKIIWNMIKSNSKYCVYKCYY